MKYASIVPFAITLLVGFALGAFLSPVFHSGNDSTDTEAAKAAGNSALANSSASRQVSFTSTVDLASALREGDAFHRTQDVLAYVQSIPLSDMPGALLQVEKTPDNDLAESLLIARWVSADPDGARAAIPQFTDHHAQYLVTQAVYSTLAASDPSGALVLAGQLPTKILRDSATSAVIGQVARTDPPAALKMCEAQKNPASGQLKSVFSPWADRDLNQATEAALNLPRAADRDYMIQTIGERLGQKDPSAALAWLDGLQLAGQDHTRSSIVSRWAFTDPKAAAEYLRHLQGASGSWSSIMDQAVASIWAQSDPRAAVSWAQGFTGEQKKAALQSALNSWCRDDPKAVAAYWSSLGSDPDTQAFLVHVVASSWTQSDPQSALNWANQLPPGPVRDQALAGVLSAWSSADPGAASRQAANLPEGPQKNEIYATLATNWAKDNPTDASTWLTQLPSGPSRDGAVKSFANQVASDDPKSAFQWAESIGDTKLRDNQVETILERWQATDPTAASAAAQQSTLPPSQKSRFLPASH